ncbi:PREDICTED: uncharacterized protein C5orf34 homolog [Cyprinodon variegatus]|uniref:uncharacterized protein C5orf34 homolog n=1 Tax=Cyprinodon variegatus TaxID=28743 RepID=UPI0007427D07|nr:PREDICTED: uncharacterized protein C5orf34 homolog [Cyprinodon variegatus]
MEESERISMMMMYEDESVEVRYRNGAQLQLSPCGSEFLLLKVTDPHRHPLQPTERVRQRTRFTISAYKELMVTALAFRNQYASRPYLPSELITANEIKPFFTIDCSVTWPEWSSYEPEFGPAGEITVRSEEGRAALVLSPSGEEFSVEFTCNLSRPLQQTGWGLNKDADGGLKGLQQENNLICRNTDDQEEQMHPGKQSVSANLKITNQPKPEQMYQTTTVIKHHSCIAVDPAWTYALSLARHHWTSCFSNSTVTTAEEARQAGEGREISDKNPNNRVCQLPQALPLSCPSPHWHRWKMKDSLLGEEESDLPMELVKIVWCQGVTYRILNGAVPVVEVSPGDGSVMRSNGFLNSYFTHHKPKLQSEEVREVTYHLSSLPPDIPGQLYSVGSIVSRANRILACYNQAKSLLKFPALPSCLQQDKHISEPTFPERNLSSEVPVTKLLNPPQTEGSVSDVVAAELEKIKRFNFLLENNHLLRNKTESGKSEATSLQITPEEAVNEDYIAAALQRTSETIKEIDELISAATLN